MTIEEMQDTIIRQLGMEHDYTINFCRACENPNLSKKFLKHLLDYYLDCAWEQAHDW